eukprot:PITA_30603
MGSIYHAINSTFIALIPKSDAPDSFDDYRPISLCNCLYKIISKTIANHLRPILCRSIAPQQFAFLESRQIHEVVGLAHESIHSIWSRHLKGILLKIDLSKAFDRVSWLYIKMILIHLGFPHTFISWIMACISSPTFSILINGSATPFFHSERGLRQGCPLSPLLFLLVMEGLSRLIDSAKRSGDFRGLRITDICYLTHLLFVDDVLILLDGSVRDSRTFSKILLLFTAATGMFPNQSKSTITCSRTSVQELRLALQVFPYEILPLDQGLKYLGFRLKPTCQRIADWVWLVAKLEKRLTGWSFRYLFRAGRLVLIKSVLEATPVFWMALTWIPRNILGRLKQLCSRYLWNGNQDKRIFAWISWKKITLPKKWGGWGLKDLPDFAMALAAKMGWLLLSSQNLWAQGRIGLDPWIGSGDRNILSRELITFLHDRDIRCFAHIADHQRTDIFSQAWKSAQQLDLPPQWHREWSKYVHELNESHIRIKQGSDELVWCLAENGIYAPKIGYGSLIMHREPEPTPSWWRDIWKLNAPPRTRLFFWCVLKYIIPTGDHLTRRSIYGPSWCSLCKEASETTVHLFLQCPATCTLWNNISVHIHFSGNWRGDDITSTWTDWNCCHPGSNLLNLPLMVTWHIWLARN